MPLEPYQREILERVLAPVVKDTIVVMRTWGLPLGDCFYELGSILGRIEKMAMEAEHKEADIGG